MKVLVEVLEDKLQSGEVENRLGVAAGQAYPKGMKVIGSPELLEILGVGDQIPVDIEEGASETGELILKIGEPPSIPADATYKIICQFKATKLNLGN
jgi:hypothetical protein